VKDVGTFEDYYFGRLHHYEKVASFTANKTTGNKRRTNDHGQNEDQQQPLPPSDFDHHHHQQQQQPLPPSDFDHHHQQQQPLPPSDFGLLPLHFDPQASDDIAALLASI
jgi:hypothetical protein